MLNFSDRVAIVTGAGGGLGRAHALALAQRGAKVVVNDLGGGPSGDGASASVAQAVVNEITSLGGQAIANTDSVEEGEKIVQSAIDNFGRIDIVINNAGILRDTSFHNLKPIDWDLIQRVHLGGTYSVTRAAWPGMRAQGYGRIVMTASGAGIYGNFGQANYSAAKLGILGLAQTLAVEGASKGIRVNTIAPIAASRLTETVMPPSMLTALKPEYVSSLVLLLAHERCPASGEVYEVGGGWFSRLRWQRSLGLMLEPDLAADPEALERAWDKVEDFTNAEFPKALSDSLTALGRHLGVNLSLSKQA